MQRSKQLENQAKQKLSLLAWRMHVKLFFTMLRSILQDKTEIANRMTITRRKQIQLAHLYTIDYVRLLYLWQRLKKGDPRKCKKLG